MLPSNLNRARRKSDAPLLVVLVELLEGAPSTSSDPLSHTVSHCAFPPKCKLMDSSSEITRRPFSQYGDNGSRCFSRMQFKQLSPSAISCDGRFSSVSEFPAVVSVPACIPPAGNCGISQPP